MDIININTQNAFNTGRMPEPRFPETATEANALVTVPGNTKTKKLIFSNTEAGQNINGVDKNEMAEERLSDHGAEDMLSKAIKEANKKLEPMSVEFQFSYHEKTGYVNVKIINSDTKEIVREVPSEKALDMLVKVRELAGIIVDDKK